jgi:anti-sigma-K factor RskA
MKHLSPADVVDIVDGCAREQAALHAESCDRCRGLVDQARQAIRRAAPDQIPEPSPLFWEQFSDRVSESVRRVPEPSGWWASLSFSSAAIPVGSLIVIVALVGLTVWQNRTAAPTEPAAEITAALVSGEQLESPLTVLESDEPWMLISRVRADLESDETLVADMSAPVGSADQALNSLSDGEKHELARLLKAEIGEPGVAP